MWRKSTFISKLIDVVWAGALKSSGAIVLYVSVQRRIHPELSGKKWFIRIGHLWGLQAGEWVMLHPENLLGYSYIIKGKMQRGRRVSLSFLTRCHASIINSFSRLSRGVFLSLLGQASSTNYCCMCVQRACCRESLTFWAHWAVCGSHATIISLFWGTSRASAAWFCC